ncbi:DUF3352 domain-containing protein, partial [Patescibacteria group bacterium]
MEQTHNIQTKKSPNILGKLFLVLIIVGVVLAIAWVATILFYDSSDSRETKFFPEETLTYMEIKVDANETLGLGSFLEKLKLKPELEKEWKDDFALLPEILNLGYEDEIEPSFKGKTRGGLVRVEEEPLIEGLVFALPLSDKEKAVQFLDKICEGLDKQTQDHEGVEINIYSKLSFYYFFNDQYLVTTTSEELAKLAVDCNQGRHSTLSDSESFKKVREQESSFDVFVYFNPQTIVSGFKNQFVNGLGNLFSNYLVDPDQRVGLWLDKDGDEIKVRTFVTLPENYPKNLGQVTESTTELLKEVPKEAAFCLVGRDLKTNQTSSGDQLIEQEQLSIFGDLKQFLSDSFLEDLDYFFGEDYLISGSLKENQLFPTLVFSTPNSFEASEKMRELEQELEEFLETFFSQKTRTFILPDSTKSKEVIRSSLSFKDDLIGGIKIRKIDFGSGNGFFYGFKENKLFVAFERDVFVKLVDQTKESITTDEYLDIWEKGNKRENCIIDLYLDLDKLAGLDKSDSSSSKLFYSLFSEVV